LTTAERDRFSRDVTRRIVSVEMTAGPGPLPHGEAEFVGFSVEEGRTLKFAPGHPPRTA
jgi:hypothetical protein